MLDRHLRPLLRKALTWSPVALVTGARQVGKSTLARAVAQEEWAAEYVTLDDRLTLDAALRDPDGFLAGYPKPIVLDEVQKAPDLMRAIKKRVDENRRPGRYLLTGSANLMTMKTVSETLAGRVVLFDLEPFSWEEIARTGPAGALDILLKCADAGAAMRAFPRLKTKNRTHEIRQSILRGGFPLPARFGSVEKRRAWFASYRSTYIERDARDLAAIERLPEFSQLLSILALRTGQLINFAQVCRDARLPMMTLRRYCGLLETTYQIFYLRPFLTNRTSSLIKSPKMYLTDPGLACALSNAWTWEDLEAQGRIGALVETWVACELRRWLSYTGPGTQIYFWASHRGKEVDFVLERPDRVLGIEVKLSSRLEAQELAGLSEMRRELGKRMGLGVLAYGGDQVVGIDRNTLAIPFRVLFGPDAPGAGSR
jgi:predicted AAA+ superfamily ATPase